uniref:Uncharacterized protein n=1 Tax=Salvator merianae TaxID=96440 RepID=A0A8D0BHE8_SALMN
MAGHDVGTQHQFTGIKKYFNSYTIIGRRNCLCCPITASTPGRGCEHC